MAWCVLQPLAGAGRCRGAALVGNMYARGLGDTYDGAEAVRWWRKAAEQGDASAQEELATVYFCGNGVEQDHSEAAKWFLKAAEQGELSHGSLPPFCTSAAKAFGRTLLWRTLNLAAAQGQPVAKIELDRLASKMTSGQVPEAQRLARERRPSAVVAGT
jgi:TPR repeat protein